MDIKKILSAIKIKLPEKTKKETAKIPDKRNKYIFILRLISILIMALLVGVIIATVVFVYGTVMNTIGQVESISLYQSELRVELIDFNRLDKIEKGWERKNDINKPEAKSDPFVIIKEAPAVLQTATSTGNTAGTAI